MKHVGVIGAGVLGGLLVEWFRGRFATVPLVEKVSVWDPPLKLIDDLRDCDVIFICVPTPEGENGTLVSDALLDAVEVATFEAKPRTIVIRSTLVPGTLQMLRAKHPDHHWVFLPEFLTERSAKDDFEHPDAYVIGEDPPFEGVWQEHPLLKYMPHTPDTKYTWCPSFSAELVKLASNAFYATKLSFMNELYDALPALEPGGEDVAQAVFEGLSTLWMVGRQHLNVHQDGYRGFGGKCLPKDSKALLGYSQRVGAEMTVLRGAIEYNDRLRSSK